MGSCSGPVPPYASLLSSRSSWSERRRQRCVLGCRQALVFVCPTRRVLHRLGGASASSMQTKTRAQPAVAAGVASSSGIGSGTQAAHPSPTTWLQKERREDRPSTPKGVGREAPLTAGPRGAENAVRSAGKDTTKATCGGGRECGRTRGSSVHSNSALQCGWRRPPAADHPQSPLTLNMSGNWWWSAAGGLRLAGGPSCCGRGVVAGAVGVESWGGCVGGGDFETKPGRFGYVLRLGFGWWLR